MVYGHRQEKCNVRDFIRADHSDDANEVILVIGPDENAPFGIGRILGLHCVEAFVEMPERSALPDRCFVVDVDDARYQIIGELRLLHHHANSRRLPDGRSFRGVYPILPPIRKGSDWNDGQIVPFEVKRVSGDDVRQLLSKREDVGLQAGLLQSLNDGRLIDREFTLNQTLIMKARDPGPPARGDYRATKDLG